MFHGVPKISGCCSGTRRILVVIKSRMVESPSTLTFEELVPRLACTSVSCCVADALCLPMETVKVRLQLQNELEPAWKPRRSFFGMATSVLRLEGPTGFFAGLTPAMVRQAVYGGLSFWSYPLIRDALGGSVLAQVTAGMLAGGSAAAVANPTDVVKVRLQARRFLQGRPRPGVTATFRAVLDEGGLGAFYAGVGPNCTRAAVVNGVGMFSYDYSKAHVVHRVFHRLGVDERKYPIAERFAAALVGGVASTVAGCPFDVVKTRLMARATQYRSPWHCLVATVKIEGPLALWKGAFPVYTRQAPFNVLNYLIMESLFDLLKK